MQAFVPSSRLHLTPVRDEEAESQRRAKSRHARQTRRSTQGVTLTDLKEAQKISSRSEEDLLEDKDENNSTEAKIISRWSNTDEQGNIRAMLQSVAEFTEAPGRPSPSIASVNFFRAGGGRWKDENQNPLEEEEHFTFSTIVRGRRRVWDGHEECEDTVAEHDRLSRYDSSGDNVADKLGRTSSYTRRETRLASLSKQEQDTTSKDYKKMYAEALHENERLKSRLQDSKQELVNIRSQLEKVTQRQDRMSEKSTQVEAEKKEKQALEKRVSGMEDEIKVLTELKADNQRLKDENGALIRVISKLSK
ncbi:protein phosphatase 1 regulatory subunit 12B isoform X2 [Nerophis ophidion]|uniref:protein phosphatase 1 regulatory subunit 12B isoform X2 n=1 Tax=Nerophis ophidion TaxID=159077 RepID=UPI002AE019AB|nr:protein phosphatase 1 regulatory subunit 12B isoform X2 [Nerophis ophidion]